MSLWRFFLLPSLLLALVACKPQPPAQPPRTELADLQRLPQDLSAYLHPENAAVPLVATAVQTELDAAYNRRFFTPWEAKRATVRSEQAFWAANEYRDQRGFGENLQPLTTADWELLVAAQQTATFPSLLRPAIATRNTALRAMPTQRPFFLDPQRPGEGYPFDYFQASAVWVGTPLLATHVSADGAWYFVESGFAYGWLPVEDLAWADVIFRSRYANDLYAAIIRDNVTLRDQRGAGLTQAHIGAIFPLASSNATELELLIPVRDADGNAAIRTARVAPLQAARKPLPLTPGQIAGIGNAMLGERYGWGGLYANRDCSATMRDLFTPFGVWLGRNSREQGRKGGTLLDLEKVSTAEKRATILQQGIPFYSLIWLRGHIGLYLGSDTVSGEPLLLHNVWGVKTWDEQQREGRIVIGRLVVTTLRVGEELPQVRKDTLYDRVLGITLLPVVAPAAPPLAGKP